MAQGYDTDQAFPRLGARTDTRPGSWGWPSWC
jgi:hypothetical protein